MKANKLTICIVALMSCNVAGFGCLSFGDTPQEYNIYRVLDKPMRANPQFYYAPDYKQRNLEAWAEETHYPPYTILNDIENVVYKYSLTELYNLHHKGELPEWDKNNGWAERIAQRYLSEYLLLAKQCEVARAARTDPWYYPASNEEGFATLEGLLEQIDIHEKETKEDLYYPGMLLEDRYNLQRTRMYFSLGRYEDCIKLWNDYAVKLPDNNLMKTMIKDYVAGAYCHFGDTATAKQMYLEQGNYWEVVKLAHNGVGGWAGVIKSIYDIYPDCNNIVAYNMQCDLEHYISWINIDTTTYQQYYDVMCHITRTNRSQDMGLWYYTKAYIEDKLGYTNRAANTIATAEKLKTTEYMHNSIRLFRMYIDAKTLPANKAYEQKLYTDLCWLDMLIKNNISDEVQSLLIEEEKTNYRWHKMWACHPFYYYNDMMRNILLGYIAPKFLAAGKKTLALQLYNYADNVLFQQVIPDADLCFRNYFFSAMYNDCSAKEIEEYITRTQHPLSELDYLLNSGSLLDKDYLYDIAGTVYLREQNYKQALACLGKVSSSYQNRLHTEPYMNCNPFSTDKFDRWKKVGKWEDMAFPDYKYNFARQMCLLESQMNDKTVDINRRANAQLRYAIGLRNSYFDAWSLTQYSQGNASFTESYREWMNSKQEEEIIAKYDRLVTIAMKMFTDDEAAAAAHYMFLNNYTIVTQYPNTSTAAYIRGHCDTYYDYHCDQVNKRYFD